jgi:hypothetical protein
MIYKGVSMRKLDPNDIPKVLQLVAKIYTENRNPTETETKEINNFFTMYMGKAIEDCQKESANLWSPSKPKNELNFASKSVLINPLAMVEDNQENANVEFIVATTRSVVFDEKDKELFSKRTADKMISEFGYKNGGEWVVVFNRLIFGSDIKSTKAFFNGLFACIRFSRSFFEEEKKETVH